MTEWVSSLTSETKRLGPSGQPWYACDIQAYPETVSGRSKMMGEPSKNEDSSHYKKKNFPKMAVFLLVGVIDGSAVFIYFVITNIIIYMDYFQ